MTIGSYFVSSLSSTMSWVNSVYSLLASRY